ncbi:MAG: COG2426 family protein [Acutalibacteraceae bacterium]
MAETIQQWLASIGCPPYLAIFLISLLPILELRGGLIAAALMNLPWQMSFAVCYLGNILPVPFILLFIKKIFEWLKKIKPFQKIVTHFENKANKKAAESEGKTGWGKIIFVFCFVAIPLPGTGAWTGALVASFMNMKLRHSIPTILLGVLCAGAIMLTLCYWFPSIFSGLFGLSIS